MKSLPTKYVDFLNFSQSDVAGALSTDTPHTHANMHALLKYSFDVSREFKYGNLELFYMCLIVLCFGGQSLES